MLHAALACGTESRNIQYEDRFLRECCFRIFEFMCSPFVQLEQHLCKDFIRDHPGVRIDAFVDVLDCFTHRVGTLSACDFDLFQACSDLSQFGVQFFRVLYARTLGACPMCRNPALPEIPDSFPDFLVFPVICPCIDINACRLKEPACIRGVPLARVLPGA